MRAAAKEQAIQSGLINQAGIWSMTDGTVVVSEDAQVTWLHLEHPEFRPGDLWEALELLRELRGRTPVLLPQPPGDGVCAFQVL